MEIIRLHRLNQTGFSELKRESEIEGFNFLVTLEDEWDKNRNRFLFPGEGLYGAFSQEELIAIGGINIDRYSTSTDIGRLRRFYVKKIWRRKMIGKTLLFYILEHHFPFFETIRLYTDNPIASSFYNECGFAEPVGNQEKVSHELTKTSYTKKE